MEDRSSHGALALVGEEDDRAMGEVERGESGIGVSHVDEAREIVMGLGQEKVLVCGEGLVLEGDLELGLDEGFELGDCDVRIINGDSLKPISASNSEHHLGVEIVITRISGSGILG